MELTALTVNLEAAREVPRQLALRNLGGVSVVDFIDLENRNKREQVMEALRAAAAIDPAIEWVGNMSRLGAGRDPAPAPWPDAGRDVESAGRAMASTNE